MFAAGDKSVYFDATVDGLIRFGEDTPDNYFYTVWPGVTIAKM